MTRRPSLAICTAMPSPMPPKPPRSFWASSLKFQVVGSPDWLSGLLAADIHVSGVGGWLGSNRLVKKPARGRRPAFSYNMRLAPSPHHEPAHERRASVACRPEEFHA